PARKHEHVGATVEQLPNICDLNAWNVLGTGLAPVPFAGSAWEQLRVLVRLCLAFYLEPPPRGVFDMRRTVADLHNRNFAGQRPRSSPEFLSDTRCCALRWFSR